MQRPLTTTFDRSPSRTTKTSSSPRTGRSGSPDPSRTTASIVRLGVGFGVPRLACWSGMLVRGALGPWREGRRNGPIPPGAVAFNVDPRRCLCSAALYRGDLLSPLAAPRRSTGPTRLGQTTKVALRVHGVRVSRSGAGWRRGASTGGLIPKVAELKDGFVVQTTSSDGEWIPRHATDEPLRRRRGRDVPPLGR